MKSGSARLFGRSCLCTASLWHLDWFAELTAKNSKSAKIHRNTVHFFVIFAFSVVNFVSALRRGECPDH
jgi:hypothetical protein